MKTETEKIEAMAKNRNFKQWANVYKILALADMDNGVPKARFETEIKKQTDLENYEVCEGLKQAINIKNKEDEQ